MKTTPHRESVIEELTRIYDMASQLQTLLQHNSPCGAVELSEDLLQSLTAALSILNPSKDQLISFQHPECTKPSSSYPSFSIKTEVDAGCRMIPKSDVIRNCNPSFNDSGNPWSRKTVPTESPYFNGHEWKKYGQKNIRGDHFPRCYYRCNDGDEQGCPAIKQVQQKDLNHTPMFQVIYDKQHTCKSSFIAPRVLWIDEEKLGVKREQFPFSSYYSTQMKNEQSREIVDQHKELSSPSGCPMSPEPVLIDNLDSDMELIKSLLAPIPDPDMACLGSIGFDGGCHF